MPPSVDPELQNIGQHRGLEVWRIKKFALEKVPKEQHGNFYIGDSYIVLHTRNPGEWNVHFWLGNETTQDEKGVAAIKTVELDDALGGLPVQYREVQGHESPLFLSYFKEGIKYLKGGAPSAFTHVEDEFKNWKPRLYQCKGKRNVRCTQVDCKKDSLNLGDVFILDCGRELYVWMPPESGRLERIKGMAQARTIRDKERSGVPVIHALDSDWDTEEGFWKMFGGPGGTIKSAEAGGKDENFWLGAKKQIILYRVSDQTGTMKVDVVSKGHFEYSQLQSQDAFILDAGNGGVFVWVGKGCTMDERKKAMSYATKYLEEMKRPATEPIVRVLEGAEPANFIQWASKWETTKKTPPFRPKLFQCSDSSGRLVAEQVADFTQEDLDGDDVMILDTLKVIYVWIGAGANPSEKRFAQNVANRYLEGSAIPRPANAEIVKFDQGHETPEFKKFFPSWNDGLFHAGARSVESMKKTL